MGIPLFPIIVGVTCFLVGLGAGRVKFVSADTDASAADYFGEPVGVLMKDGAFHEGNLQDLSSDSLTLEVGEQSFMSLALDGIKQVEVYAN